MGSEMCIRDSIKEITDFVHEMEKPLPSENLPLSATDQAKLESRFAKFMEDLNPSTKSVLASLSIEETKELALSLGVKKQVVTALRKKLILVETISEKFIMSVCEALGCLREKLEAELRTPYLPKGPTSHSSDGKPRIIEAVSFEETLRNAGHSEEEITQFRD